VKRRMKSKRFVFGLACLAACTLALGFLLFGRLPAPQLGVTFSYRYAEYLGLDWKQAYTATLDDLGVRHLRVPIYWDEAEAQNDVFTTDQVDWMLDEAAKRGAHVTLAVGMKVPRWPECYLPSWTSNADVNLDDEVTEYVAYVVDRYKAHPAISAWQIENEPFLSYGTCPSPSPERVEREVAQAREIDPHHPIVITVSGELETWVEVSRLADVVGASLYRYTWNDTLGPMAFPYPAAFYRVQGALARLFADRVILSELQMEPWFDGDERSLTSSGVPFTVSTFHEHLDFAERSGFDEVWLWGVEWWYFVRTQGDSSLWNVAQETFSH
jgi:hypothetical protein